MQNNKAVKLQSYLTTYAKGLQKISYQAFTQSLTVIV